MKKKKVLLKNIYIDVDGVILTRGVTPALHLDEFLKHILKNYSVFWLTSRCNGNSAGIVKYLSQFLLPETIALLGEIKPTSFQLDKTEAIDFDKRFFWLDNELFDSEKNMLRKHDNYDSWIEVDLIKNPNQLLYLMNHNLYA